MPSALAQRVGFIAYHTDGSPNERKSAPYSSSSAVGCRRPQLVADGRQLKRSQKMPRGPVTREQMSPAAPARRLCATRSSWPAGRAAAPSTGYPRSASAAPSAHLENGGSRRPTLARGVPGCSFRVWPGSSFDPARLQTTLPIDLNEGGRLQWQIDKKF